MPTRKKKTSSASKLDYRTTVNYAQADPAKIAAQQAGLATAQNLPFGFREVAGTRGESAYVFDMGDCYGALVQEGLGTKSLVAQAVYEQTGESFFAAIAQDTVACIINDLISVGATPVSLNAYWSSSSYQWLTDQTLTRDFIEGWCLACDEAGVTWGGGETQALSHIIAPGALEFAGSAFGLVKPKEHLQQGEAIQPGDAIVLVEASGVHANGISLLRDLAPRLPDGYQTKLPDGQTFGQAILRPAHIYAKLLRELFAANVIPHYLSNITGHGWRKLMRATSAFTYRIHQIPPVAPLFNVVAQETGSSSTDMYAMFTMGAGYALYLPSNQAQKAVRLAAACGLQAWHAGNVEAGPKQVIIEPLGITFASESLELRHAG